MPDCDYFLGVYTTMMISSQTFTNAICLNNRTIYTCIKSAVLGKDVGLITNNNNN